MSSGLITYKTAPFIEKISIYIKEQGFFGFAKMAIVRTFLPTFKLYRRAFCDNYFLFEDKKYEYFINKYNVTWLSERAVEIPILFGYLESSLLEGKKVLEVGHVLGHYKNNNGSWDVVDICEKAPGVINHDIVDFVIDKKYDLIVSISTMEHVGFDEEDKDEKKVEKSIKNVKDNLLNPGGHFIFTVPLGYNKLLDQKVFSNSLGAKFVKYLKRDAETKWHKANKNEVKNSRYGGSQPGTDGLAIVYVEKVK